MDRTLFIERLTHREAQDFIDGVARRYRAGWEQARLIADVVARVAGNKDGIGLAFPWEDETRPSDSDYPTDEEYREMLKHAKL